MYIYIISINIIIYISICDSAQGSILYFDEIEIDLLKSVF